MKKIKFNRFNIIIISSVFIVLLFFVVSLFHTYSDIVNRDASKVEGDTVYVNELASDYYYWLGMNYVGDFSSSSTSYQESDLKMVTINYYGYPNGNASLTGYVSLDNSERQNKFVYYKYFPIKNGQISFDLIDNPFSDRPSHKGFNGWTSSDGTITTDTNTKVQKITVNSSVDTINIYASWADANVIYLKGKTGDDNLDGTRPDRAVGSWSKAFDLLRSRSTNQNNRELNIIVLTGDIDYSLNYSQTTTQSYSSTNTTYTETNSFEDDIIIAYQNGNNYYALTDNNSSIASTTLTSSMEVPDNVRWKVTSVTGGYTIQNYSTGRYLTASQNGFNISMSLSNSSYVWENDSNINAFYHDFTFIYTLYTYESSSSITSGNNYLITKGSNALSGASNNFVFDQYTYSSDTEWRITNVSGDQYTLYNVNNSQYLNYSNANNSMNLVFGNAFNWTYDSTNKNFHATLTHHIENDYFDESDIDNSSSTSIGYVDNSGNAVLVGHSTNNTPTSVSVNIGDTIPSTADWSITTGGTTGTYHISYSNNGTRYLARSGNTSTTLQISTSTSYANWYYDTSDHYLYQRRTGGNEQPYYLYRNSGGSWAITTSQSSATRLYIITPETSVNEYTETMYIAYNNGWKLENSTTNAQVDLKTVTSELVNETKPYYLRYDTTSSSFVLENNQTGASLKRL